MFLIILLPYTYASSSLNLIFQTTTFSLKITPYDIYQVCLVTDSDSVLYFWRLCDTFKKKCVHGTIKSTSPTSSYSTPRSGCQKSPIPSQIIHETEHIFDF